MEYGNMTEVLPVSSHRFDMPVGTSLDIDGVSSQQQWICHVEKM